MQQQVSSEVLAQVKELAAQVLPVELVALSTEPAPQPDEALPPAETHQVRQHPSELNSGARRSQLVLTGKLASSLQAHMQKS